jgi:hypothetical protein
VSTLRCREPSHCEFMKNNCFSNPNLCNYQKQKQFYSNETKRCYNYKDGDGFSCASVPYSHLNGIIQCGARGLVRHFLFFVSLEFLRRNFILYSQYIFSNNLFLIQVLVGSNLNLLN